MTEDMLDLARRAVACKGWRWMGGMRTANEERVIGVMRDDVLHLCAPLDAALESVSITRVFFDSSGSCLPDLTDSATLGCLLALVREAWGVTHLSTYPWQRGWEVVRVKKGTSAPVGFGGYWPTEAHALVASLEAAP